MEEKNNVSPEQNQRAKQKEDAGTACEAAGAKEAQDEAGRKCQEYLELAQRVQADFENYKRRNANLYQEAYQQGRIDAVMAFLPVLDNIERALNASLEAGEESKLSEGVQMVCKQFCGALESLGIEEIPAVGEAFDPNLHEAVLREETGDPADAGKVIDTMLKGYRSKDRVLRFAMVKVAQ
ncbi:MAG: nucleotide exchange factor GrpE [Christensenellales bacterium]